jgi:Ca2+-binding RTX toxin-like protein
MNLLLPLKTGKNRTSSHRRACRNLRLESLEHRRLMTGVTYDPMSGKVTIEGGDYNDYAKCTWNVQTQQLTVDWGIGELAKPAVPQHKVISGPVKLIVFKGYGGNDKFTNDTPIVCDVDGGEGNDTLIGGSANDTIHGGPGNDTIQGRGGTDFLFGDEDNDTIDGGDGGDVIVGGKGDDMLLGGAGEDVLVGCEGNDTLHGGAGNDFLVGYVLEGANYDPAGYDLPAGQPDNDFLYGEAGNDELHGGPGDDMLSGGVGTDKLFGEGGNDQLIGGYDNCQDQLNGGKGHDKFFEYYGLNGTEHEKVLDYKAGEDTMVLGPDPLYFAGWWQQNGKKVSMIDTSLDVLAP